MVTLLPLLGLALVFFIWGFFVARAFGRSGFAWGLACGLTFFIGIAILYSLGRRTTQPLEPIEGPSRHEQEAPRDTRTAPSLGAPGSGHALPRWSPAAAELADAEDDAVEADQNADDSRWRYLSDYHPEVRKAVNAVTPLGEAALAELKMAHLAIGDAALLPAIVQRIGERFGGAARQRLNGAATSGQTLGATPAAKLDDVDDEEPLMLDAPVAAKSILGRSPTALNGAHTGETGAMAASPPQPASLAEPIAGSATAGSSRRGASLLAAAPATIESLSATPAEETDTAPDIDDDEPVAGDSPHDSYDPAESSSDDASAHSRDSARHNREESDGEDAGDDNDGHGDADSDGGSPGAPLPDRTVVMPSDLVGARYLETYAGVHLFGLADGRVFIDRHEARSSLDLARNFVDQLAIRRSAG